MENPPKKLKNHAFLSERMVCSIPRDGVFDEEYNELCNSKIEQKWIFGLKTILRLY